MKPALIFAVSLSALLLPGCSTSPESVFMDSSDAFSRGEVRSGVHHFSQRLLQNTSIPDLEYYYHQKQNRDGVKFLLEDLQFQVLEENNQAALARVIWRTGKMEAIRFIREEGVWKIDGTPDAAEQEQLRKRGFLPSASHKKKPG